MSSVESVEDPEDPRLADYREIRDDRVVYSANVLWPGTYTATFTVRDNMGAQTSDTAAVVVSSPSSCLRHASD